LDRLDKIILAETLSGTPPPTIAAPTRGDVVLDLARASTVRVENLVLTGGRVGVAVRDVGSADLWSLTLEENDIGVSVDPPPSVPAPPHVQLLLCDLWNNHTALHAGGGFLRVEDARFRGNLRSVNVSGGERFELQRSVVAHSVGDVGVWIHDAKQAVVGDTFFWGNTGWAALLIDRSDGTTVSRSTFNGNTGTAVRVQRSADVLLDHVHSLQHVDPRLEAPKCESPSADLDTGGLIVRGLDDMADCTLEPEEVEYPEEDNLWMGNGLEIVQAQDVMVWKNDLTLNRGVGLFIDGSTHVWATDSSISVNAGGGVYSRETEGLLIAQVEATFNAAFGVRVVGGAGLVERSWIEWTGPNGDGEFGFGLWLANGTVAAIGNDVLECNLAGVFTQGPPDPGKSAIRIERNRIHDSPYGIVKNEGSYVVIDANEITCELGDQKDCAETWASLYPAPASPPATPVEPDGQ
jgi:hypothetical protein